MGQIIILSIALLVLIGSGGGMWYLLTKPAYETVSWATPGFVNKNKVDIPHRTRNVWFLDGAVIQALPDGINAYDSLNGRRLWGTALPGSGNVTCTASSVSTGDVAVLGYGEPGRCDHVAAYDLRSGKELWTKSFTMKSNSDSVVISRSGSVVVVDSNAGNAQAFRASDGKRPWNPARARTKQCAGSGTYTGGTALIRIQECMSEDYSDEWAQVSLIDPETGRATWTRRFDDESMGDVSTVSSSPVVLMTQDKGLIALDDKTGKVRSKFSPGMPAGNMTGGRSYGDADSWAETSTFGNTFVISGSDSDQGEVGVVAAYDLDSGKQLWKHKEGQRHKFLPIQGADGKRILVYDADGASVGPQLLEFDRNSGKKQVLVQYPDKVDMSLGAGSLPYWYKNQLFVASKHSQGIFQDEERHALVALKTKA